MYRLGVPICARLRSNLVAAEDINNPLYEPPPIRWAWVRLLAWYGEALSPRSKVTEFILETPNDFIRGSLGRLSEAIEHLKPHLVFL
ncbi:MAG: hypothetical protein RQ885_01140 [Desulfurococcales archaeon]|jgi:hypothetical protein|nr:hypothetical protein [Desulfurococcales archaeon]